ncbi:hypothetical protein WR25_19103 [Diploscapter pachys]|uniref:C-type lectin domain-containing protein n=1 Tax=Diploscapter pachys TaxID=2018661 RepID=A0A2A2LNE5_9BILA|nr:hypothetical protein WR25_19103 [Diploscapter pachys]
MKDGADGDYTATRSSKCLSSIEFYCNVDGIGKGLTETGTNQGVRGFTWIGLRKDSLNGPWYWIDGQDSSAFIAWALPDEPNNLDASDCTVENDFVADLTRLGLNRNSTNMTWIGLKQDTSSGSWHWIDGSDFDGYTNWASLESRDSEEASCAQIISDLYLNYPIYYKSWESINCSSQSRAFVCKKPKINEGVTSWSGAEKACQELGGHLVSVASEEENNFVYEITTNPSGKTTTGFDHQVWLGIRKNVNGSNDTTWRLMNHSEATFLAWGSDEPGKPGITFSATIPTISTTHYVQDQLATLPRMKALSGYILLLLAVSIRTDASSGLLEKLRVRRDITEEVMDKYYSTVYDLNLSADQKWDILQKLPTIYQTGLKDKAAHFSKSKNVKVSSSIT